MIHKLEDAQKLDLKIFSLDICPGDTIIIQSKLDKDNCLIWDMSTAQEILKMWQIAFPNNKILLSVEGCDIERVIHEIRECD